MRNYTSARTHTFYDPNVDRRRCPACGARSGWQRSTALNGGWVHCPPEWVDGDHAGTHHICGPLCADRLGGAA